MCRMRAISLSTATKIKAQAAMSPSRCWPQNEPWCGQFSFFHSRGSSLLPATLLRATRSSTVSLTLPRCSSSSCATFSFEYNCPRCLWSLTMVVLLGAGDTWSFVRVCDYPCAVGESCWAGSEFGKCHTCVCGKGADWENPLNSRPRTSAREQLRRRGSFWNVVYDIEKSVLASYCCEGQKLAWMDCRVDELW